MRKDRYYSLIIWDNDGILIFEGAILNHLTSKMKVDTRILKAINIKKTLGCFRDNTERIYKH